MFCFIPPHLTTTKGISMNDSAIPSSASVTSDDVFSVLQTLFIAHGMLTQHEEIKSEPQRAAVVQRFPPQEEVEKAIKFLDMASRSWYHGFPLGDATLSDVAKFLSICATDVYIKGQYKGDKLESDNAHHWSTTNPSGNADRFRQILSGFSQLCAFVSETRELPSCGSLRAVYPELFPLGECFASLYLMLSRLKLNGHLRW